MKRTDVPCYCPQAGNSTFLWLLRPIGDHPAFFGFAALVPLLPDLAYSFGREMTFVVWRTLILATLLSFFRAYVLALPLCLESRGGGSGVLRAMLGAYRTIVAVVLGLTSLAESFLALRFGTLCSPSILQVLWETDRQESLEFLRTYCSSAPFLLTVLFFGLLLAGYAALQRKKPRLELHSRASRRALLILLLLGTCVAASRIRVFCKLHRMATQGPAITAPSTPVSTFERIHTALAGNNFSPASAERILQLLESARVDSCSFRSECIVLILGESFNKHHSNLYGYGLPTNPRLAERCRRGELCVFTDVVTPANLTTSVMNQLFSPASLNAGRRWDEAPLFPALFRKAGYSTYLIDNQIAGSVSNFHDLGQKNLFNTRSNALLFTACNDRRHAQDLALLDDYAAVVPGTDRAELTIFHLMGQHVHYGSRFPAEEAFFAPDDYDHPDLRPGQKRILADYDNATRYNDRVVDALLERFAHRDAIVLYLSDHGEELYDYRNRFGRTYTPLTPGICRYQFEVPMMIWMSESYHRNHPDVAAQVARAAQRPFTTDELPHLLLDLAGIRCPWYDPTRSPLDDRYDASRPRLLLLGYEVAGDYDRIMQEEGPERAR